MKSAPSRFTLVAYRKLQAVDLQAKEGGVNGFSRFQIWQGQIDKLRAKFEEMKADPELVAAELQTPDGIPMERFDHLVEAANFPDPPKGELGGWNESAVKLGLEVMGAVVFADVLDKDYHGEDARPPA